MMRVLLLLALLSVTSLAHAQSAGVTYIYDELGRLVAVIAPSGDAAVYTYDPVGNLLSIARLNTGAVSILEFTPNAGPVGTIVTLSGTGFSSVTSQNAVSFNGVPAAVLTASPTALTVGVPSGATSGPISVTSPTGSANSGSAFSVTAATLPTITGFVPSIATPSTGVTITGTNFEPTPTLNKLTVNVMPIPPNTATPTTLGITLPAVATTGRIRVATPGGVATSADYLWVPPAPYMASDVAGTSVLSPSTAATVSMGTAGKIGLFAFEERPRSECR